MAQLKDKIDYALEEGLILITAAEVLVGFQFRSIFEAGFEKLPITSQYLKLSGLALLLSALALLIAPASYHRIVNRGEDSLDLHRFTTFMLSRALLPFAFGLGIDFYVAVEKINGATFAIGAAAVIILFALFW